MKSSHFVPSQGFRCSYGIVGPLHRPLDLRQQVDKTAALQLLGNKHFPDQGHAFASNCRIDDGGSRVDLETAHWQWLVRSSAGEPPILCWKVTSWMRCSIMDEGLLHDVRGRDLTADRKKRVVAKDDDLLAHQGSAIYARLVAKSAADADIRFSLRNINNAVRHVETDLDLRIAGGAVIEVAKQPVCDERPRCHCNHHGTGASLPPIPGLSAHRPSDFLGSSRLLFAADPSHSHHAETGSGRSCPNASSKLSPFVASRQPVDRQGSPRKRGSYDVFLQAC